MTALQSLHPELKVAPEAAIHDAAWQICEGFDAGLDSESMAQAALASELPPPAAGAIIGLAVNAMCPEYRDEMPLM